MRPVDHGSALSTGTASLRRTARTAPTLVSIFVLIINCPANADVFIPPDGAPDYVVTYLVEAGGSVRKPRTKTVSHHGAWTRIEQSGGDHPSISYVAKSRRITQRFWSNNAASVAGFSEEWGERQDGERWQTDARRTTERRLIAGERCTVWLVWHSLQQKLEKKSCVTEDGIEVASFTETDRGTLVLDEAVKVERRALRAEDVTPARHLFDPAFWFSQAELQASTADVTTKFNPNDEVRLKRSDETRPSARSGITEVRRRYGTVTSIMTLKSDGEWQHKLSFGSRLLFVFQSDASGAYGSFSVTHLTGHDGHVKMDRAPDIILGESCIWYDDAPGMMDASSHNCETPDGAVLKTVQRSRSHLNEMTAQILRRGANQPADFSLPSNLSDMREWQRSGIRPHDNQ
ncbi:MAG: hypothetical protein WAP03_01015 [Methylorubrum rhodinum]|uniref:hypothetical protein n=1 Tax=Methylorubrum rhodinum TaxID=29428 RepID=UPI003BB1CBF1